MRSRIQHPKIDHRRLDSHPHIQHGLSARDYYWIWFDKDETHKGLWGSFGTYEEAERKAVSKLNVPYEIVKLKTRDQTRAGQLLRAGILGDTGDTELAFNRFSHKEG